MLHFLQLLQAAEGLDHLHTLDPPIAHGDIKTENVIVNDDIESALVDFGLSRVLVGLDLRTGLTTSGRGQGTGGYTSPEILNGDMPSLAGDVYAFGSLILAVRGPVSNLCSMLTTAFQVLTGHVPFWKLKGA